MRVFVVDDDPTLRELTAELLADGIDGEIEVFANGAGLLAAMERSPDVVLLDVEMRGMNGIETCRTLRERGYDDAQVIFVSGTADPATRAAAYAAGGNDFVAKGGCCRGSELVAKVRAAGRVAQRMSALAAEVKTARLAALDAMVAMLDMDVVTDFMLVAQSCEDCRQLAEAAGKAIKGLELGGQLVLRDDADVHFFRIGSDGAAREAEPAPTSGAALDEAYIVALARVTLVATDFPVDEARAERLRAHAEALAAGIDARLAALARRAAGDEDMRANAWTGSSPAAPLHADACT